MTTTRKGMDTMRRFRWFLLIAVLAVIGAACADTPEEAGDTTGAPATTAAPGTTAAPTGTTGAVDTTAAEAAGPYPNLAAAQAGDYAGTTVDVLAQWIDAEADNFEAALAPFEEATGIEVNYEGITDYETVLATRVDGGNAPDLAQIAQPGVMQRYASRRRAVALSDWFNMDQLATDYIQSFIDLGSFEDTLYGVYYKSDLKSIVWYPVAAFAEAGYEIPTTWDELVALSDQIVADGNGNPWCISMEHGDATGWVGTDWIEDILLRTAPPRSTTSGSPTRSRSTTPTSSRPPSTCREIWFAPDYVFGGNTAINATSSATPRPRCSTRPARSAGCTSRPPGSPTSGRRGTVPGEDSAFFYFPPIEEEFGNPVLGGGDHVRHVQRPSRGSGPASSTWLRPRRHRHGSRPADSSRRTRPCR